MSSVQFRRCYTPIHACHLQLPRADAVDVVFEAKLITTHRSCPWCSSPWPPTLLRRLLNVYVRASISVAFQEFWGFFMPACVCIRSNVFEHSVSYLALLKQSVGQHVCFAAVLHRMQISLLWFTYKQTPCCFKARFVRPRYC